MGHSGKSVTEFLLAHRIIPSKELRANDRASERIATHLPLHVPPPVVAPGSAQSRLLRNPCVAAVRGGGQSRAPSAVAASRGSARSQRCPVAAAAVAAATHGNGAHLRRRAGWSLHDSSAIFSRSSKLIFHGFPTVWDGRNIAFKQLKGKWDDNFEHVFSFKVEVEKTNPGNLVDIEYEQVGKKMRFTRICKRMLELEGSIELVACPAPSPVALTEKGNAKKLKVVRQKPCLNGVP
ncbi:hypothetical protein E2562_012400 [Oryza meyeriana var. granulata]|uniref:Uncharacterized protein n=1 Tax=Oryza meyeriana var. granulata TaxID=110450 RepID=A0A6G1C556_9ORYZ|nr:hypothetical protein E2562_012400 [Oryza meyeriana var. granulata]